MHSITQQLKTKRLESNIPIEIIASELNIRKQYLLAIEENNYSNLGKVYAEGYIKLYATYLGINFDNIAIETAKSPPIITKAPVVASSRPYIESSTPSQLFLVFSFVTMLLTTYTWSWYSTTTDQNINTQPLIGFGNINDRQSVKINYDVLSKQSKSSTNKNSLDYFLTNYPYANQSNLIKRDNPFINDNKSDDNPDLAINSVKDNNEIDKNANHYNEDEVENYLGDQENDVPN